VFQTRVLRMFYDHLKRVIVYTLPRCKRFCIKYCKTP